MARSTSGLAPVEAGREHQAVEPVAFGEAVVHGEERLLEASAGLLADRACGRPACLTSRSWIQSGVASAVVHAVRALVEDAQVEVLEQRQHVGHRHRLAAAIEAQVQRAARRVARPQLACRVHAGPAASAASSRRSPMASRGRTSSW